MLEIPESKVLAGQINDTIKGKKITNVVAGYSPHRFAWLSGGPEDYPPLLVGKRVLESTAYGGMVEVQVEDVRLVFSDGTNLRYFQEGEKLPKKHQLLLTFEDGSSLTGSVQMYGTLWLLKEGQKESYNEIAREKPNPLTDAFDGPYFDALLREAEGKLSAKEFLATKQRIPGLGNGVLQDILFRSGVHPRRKIATLDSDERHKLSSRQIRLMRHDVAGRTEYGEGLLREYGGISNHNVQQDDGRLMPLMRRRNRP